MIELSKEEILEGLANARHRGARGGSVYDYTHLLAAKKGGASVIRTLNLTDF